MMKFREVCRCRENVSIKLHFWHVNPSFSPITRLLTRQSSSQRKSRCLSGKLHCLNFIFPAESETLGPECLGCDHCRPFCCRCLRSLLKRQIHSYTPLVPLKTKLNPRPKRAKCRSLFRLKWHKSHTLGGGTYVYGFI